MKSILLFTLLVIAGAGRSQSNTPCSAPPLLTPSTNCVNTAGTTVGATYQTNAANGGTPTCASPGAPDVWYSFVAPAGGQVTLETTAGTITDGGMALYSGSCPNTFTQIACDDDSGTGLMPQILATGLTPGVTYFIRFWEYGSGTGTFSICITIPAPLEPNTNCSSPDPICSGTPIIFTANTGAPEASTINPGNNYGCLFTSPNPSWYYLEIATGGNLIVDITAGSDVDFAIWGPFSNYAQAVSNCNNYGIPSDCSYSTSAVEQVNLPGVLTTQVYVLLVTNYANTVQNITVNNSGGTATTNCGIVPLPVSLSHFQVQTADRKNELSWRTQSEVNNSYFAVQRSTDVAFWETITVVPGAGNSMQELFYNSTDAAPKGGINYYRLMQVDTDGKSTYSEIVAASSTMVGSLAPHPNPARDVVHLPSLSAVQIAQIELIDSHGNHYSPEVVYSGKGAELSVSTLREGVYAIRCEYVTGEVEFARVVVL